MGDDNTETRQLLKRSIARWDNEGGASSNETPATIEPEEDFERDPQLSNAELVPPKDRGTRRAMGRGFIGKCPNCGEDRMFSGFLTLKKCAVCGEELDQYEPSLLLPLAVGIVVVTIVAHVYFALEIMGLGSPMLSISVIVPISVVVCLLIIRPFKGALVGALWTMKTKRTWQD